MSAPGLLYVARRRPLLVTTPYVPPPLATITDSFNRADSATTLGNADTGEAWIAQNGTWGISSNKAYSPSFGESAAIDSLRSNVIVQVTVSTTGGASGPIWRASGNGDLYYAQANGGIGKKVAGVATGITTLPAFANGDVIRVTPSGDTHTVLNVTTGQTTSFTDSFNNTATRHGLRTGSNAHRFDDFSIQRP